ncbi:MAG: glycosyltransferase [Rhodospirillales bacterium]|nr:glycosyltransferase [Rhodospirillales bacterium]
MVDRRRHAVRPSLQGFALVTEQRFRDPTGKRLVRGLYRVGLDLQARANIAAVRRDGVPRVYYGGARAGDRGGPLVKVAKLAQAFPEQRWGYNLLYALSNAPYLSAATLARIKGRGVAVVANQNGVFFPAWYGGDCAAENQWMSAAHDLADHVFYQSEFCRRSAEQFLGRRTGPSEVLHNAVDCRRFVPAGDRDRRDGEFIFLVAGKIGAHQSYRVTVPIEALAFVRRQGLVARLRIAGSLEPTARAEAMAVAARNGVGSAVAFDGPYAQTTAPTVFSSADAFVTVTHNDSCPSAVIEAMASGLPVVYAKSGGVPELVGDAGVAVKTGESWIRPMIPSVHAVADAMQRVAAQRDTLGAVARARAVERFDLPLWIERHRRVFESLIGGNRG